MFQEVVAAESILTFEKGASNLADLFTKVLPSNKCKVIIDGMLAWTNKVQSANIHRILALQEMGETNVVVFKYLF